MKSVWIRAGLLCLAIALGFLIGEVSQATAATSAKNDDAHDDVRARSDKRMARSHSADFLHRETNRLWEADDFAEETERLYREVKSPLRTRSMLAYHVDEKSFDEWAMLLENGQILREDLLRDVGRRLAETDPARALDLLFTHRSYRLKTMDQYYALRGGILQTVALQYPEMGLDALKKLDRGGVQMDNSLYYSAQLAWFTPEVAVNHFEELVALRNMKMEGSAELPMDRYADAIMESWIANDREAAVAYTEGLADGPKKAALRAAIEKRTRQE